MRRTSDQTILRGFVLLSLAHAALSLFIVELPGWKMFAHVERVRYRMVDGRGDSRRFDDLARLPHYITNASPLVEAAAWLARRDGTRVGLSIRGDRSFDVIVSPSGATSRCAAEDPRPLCGSLRGAWDAP